MVKIELLVNTRPAVGHGLYESISKAQLVFKGRQAYCLLLFGFSLRVAGTFYTEVSHLLCVYTNFT